MDSKEWDSQQLLNSMGIEFENHYSPEDFSNMSDHELRMMLVATEPTIEEFEAFSKEWDKRFN